MLYTCANYCFLGLSRSTSKKVISRAHEVSTLVPCLYARLPIGYAWTTQQRCCSLLLLWQQMRLFWEEDFLCYLLRKFQKVTRIWAVLTSVTVQFCAGSIQAWGAQRSFQLWFAGPKPITEGCALRGLHCWSQDIPSLCATHRKSTPQQSFCTVFHGRSGDRRCVYELCAVWLCVTFVFDDAEENQTSIGLSYGPQKQCSKHWHAIKSCPAAPANPGKWTKGNHSWRQVCRSLF